MTREELIEAIILEAWDSSKDRLGQLAARIEREQKRAERESRKKERYVPKAVAKKRAEMEARKKAKQEKREKEREERKKKYPGGTGWRKSRAAGWKEGDPWEPSKKPWEK